MNTDKDKEAPSPSLKQRVINGLGCAQVFLVPFLQGDESREMELHRIGKELGLKSKTIRERTKDGEASRQRYECVLMDASATLDPTGKKLMPGGVQAELL